ncbi:glucosaminidase domain-containing protein [Desulfotalea psychrophila]|uniref:Mannosyl-glycoprotein endo-beta-N-acetylglucosamidase-like domain-containing protein n=1 Tax=Desulfotalea psychrophila (strain LSv54 / DSM 12343) TaxID=177439 RepID=Q6AIP4_DESPS|nr:glucosaminidase domain-containing protein [Desulfotalea psychrophila]CAG37786.1 hypothetical protein DP3057 [Desulfotalea psychrophila LSv54]
MKRSIFILSVLLSLMVFYACKMVVAPEPKREAIVKEFTTGQEYLAFLVETYGSKQPARIGATVPFLFAQNLPQSWLGISTGQKAEAFVELILPEVVRANNMVAGERSRLQALAKMEAEGAHLTPDEEQWRAALAIKYGSRSGMADLLLRVDIIPPSLVLAQAILESGWGTSRFAVSGNALYGEHVPASSNAPHIKALGSDAKVAAFATIFSATESYIQNLNSHRSYRLLRSIRAADRKNGQFPKGTEMAEGLLYYSEIGDRYVKDLRSLIRRYRLNDFDQLQFGEDEQEITLKFSR